MVGHSRKGLGAAGIYLPRSCRLFGEQGCLRWATDPGPWIRRTEMVRQLKGVGHRAHGGEGHHKSLLNWMSCR